MSRVRTHGADLAVGARSRSEDLDIRVKRAGPSGLGDLEVMEYIRVRSGPFEREDGASVHLATTKARFMAD